MPVNLASMEGLAKAWRYLHHPRFACIKFRARGMMPPHVYEALYRTVADAPDLDVVEIGAAGGAGTVSMALALMETGKRGRLITVEKGEGGSRDDFGDRTANLDFLRGVLRRYGVQDRVDIVDQHLDDDTVAVVKARIRTGRIAGFVHDADGRIDRDIRFFYPMIAEGGFIVIDDYDGDARFHAKSSRYPEGGIKGILTQRLADQFVAWGLLRDPVVRGNTLFAGKGPADGLERVDEATIRAIHASVRQDYERWARTQGAAMH